MNGLEDCVLTKKIVVTKSGLGNRAKWTVHNSGALNDEGKEGSFMSDELSNDRRYTEKEIQAILKRASELQATRAENPSAADGTTLAQLQQPAAEIGIDADLIAQAAQSLNPGEDAGSSSLLAGGPWKVDFDQIVPGEVTEENWAFVVDEMRAATGRVGSARNGASKPTNSSTA